MKAVVAERGQITIPKVLRIKLGIRAGTILDFQIEKSSLVAVKAEQRDPVEQVYGCLKKIYGYTKKNISTDEIIDNLRGKV